MTPEQADDHEARISALEQHVARLPVIEERLDQVAIDAAAARHLAAAVDRDVADLGQRVARLDAKVDGLDARIGGLEIKVDANRVAINALGEHTAGGFAEMRARFDQSAAGQEAIAAMLTTLIDRGGDAAGE
ncbi:MAG: hypothetical protein ACT4QG_01400 [Sporichthyaceae bacterium]